MLTLIARAYGGADPLFEITRSSNRIFIDEGDAEPTADILRLVDKIVYFHDDGRSVALVVPILPGTLQMKWQVKFTDLRLGSALRCFVLGGNTQFISLVLVLQLDQNGRPRFNPIQIDEWEPKQGRRLYFSELANVTFEHEPKIAMPIFAKQAGVEATVDQPAAATHLTLAGDGGACAFTFTARRFVQAEKQTLRPFALRFDGEDLHEESGHRFMDITVRQPRMEDPELAAAWPAHHWIVELQIPARAAVARWNRGFVEPYIAALHTVQDGRPVSLLPLLDIDSEKADLWRAKLSLVDDVKTKGNLSFAIRQAQSPLVAGKVTIVPRSIEPESVAKATLTLPGFVRMGGTASAGAPLTLSAEIGKPAPEAEEDLRKHNEGFHFTVLHRGSGMTAEQAIHQRVRVGALDLLFAGGAIEHFEKRGVIKGGFRRGAMDGDDEMPGLPRLESLQLILARAGVRPGGQDEIPDEQLNESPLAFSDPEYDQFFRREPPILVDLTKADAASELLVDAKESTGDHASQTIALQLRQPVATATPVDVIVIDPHPFFIGKVESRLQGELNGETNEIANWSNRVEGGGWEIAGAASGFTLVLPPQGVGEQMEKRAGDFLGDDGKPRPADFRFTPNARLRLRSSFFRQRFVEAPWNLRRVLGYPGQRAPGAGVDKLAFELLYGLSANVNNDGLRLAEIAARLGHLPGRQEPRLPWRADKTQNAIYAGYRKSWKERYNALLSRLGIVEPYDSRGGSLSLTDAEGVSYELRETADLHDPIPFRNEKPFNKDGLKGGWSWGFESANILEAVLRTPKSSSGVLARPFFSALGGWGHQKASFDRNLSTIYSDTTMGRTFSISIERIGRISVFWNRAKHVIVYERTVLPTRQFVNEQDPLEGAPVLRKVREYVEVLEDTRTYPEFGEAPIVRGFVRACSFPEGSRRINVNGAWGEDVGRIGWKVPLWRKGEDEVVYPRPSIELNVAGDHPDKIVPLTIAEPDKLYFFTNTQAEMPANSDQWPAVEGIDFAQPANFTPVTPDFGAGKVKNESPRPAPVLEGSGAFTLAVDPSPHAVNVVDERTDTPIGAVMKNVTMIRGPIGADVPASSLPIVRDAIDEGIRRAKALLPADVTIPNIVKELKRARDVYKTLPGLTDKDRVCALIAARVQAEIDRTLDETGARRAFDELVAALRSVRPAVDNELAKLGETIDTITENERAALTAMRERIRDEALLAIHSVKAAAGEMPRAIREAKRVIETERKNVADLLKRLEQATGELDDWTDAQLAQFQNAVKTERTKLLDLFAKIERVIDAAGRATTGSLPDKARVILRGARRQVDILAARLLLMSKVAKSDLPKAKDVRDEIRAAATAIDKAFTDVDTALDTMKTAVEKAIANTTLEARVTAFDSRLAAAIDAAIAEQKKFKVFVEDVRALLADLEKDIEAAVRQHIDELRDTVRDKAQALCKEAIAALDDMVASARPYLEDLQKTLEQIVDGIQHSAQDLLDALDVLRDEAGRRLADLGRLIDDAIRTSAERTLRLLRAFGDTPRVPGLGFDLPEIGYLFVDLDRLRRKLTPELPGVSLSPLLARANELLDEAAKLLSPIRIELPSVELFDRLVPFRLDQFDLSSIFPDFAGLHLDGLFSNLKLPRIANEYVRVTHGFDQQAMRGWVQIDADVPYDQPATVFSIAGIVLRLLRARFHATSRIEAGAGQSPKQTFSGEITGDWDLQIGGFPVVTLVETTLRFDDRGNIRFDVSPDRVKLQAVLAFISTLMEKFGYSDSGFSIRVLPSGIRSTLDLPLPDIQGGSFGLANLRLGCIFELNFADPKFNEFAIRTRFFVGSPRAPFTLTVFILGGAGWVDVQLVYAPGKQLFESQVSIGIMAAASLAISLGPIKGGVYAYFGITVDYVSGNARPTSLTIGLLLLFRGEVCLLGFLSVGLCLALEAQYTQGGGLVGRGFVSYTIKICWCVTIEVSTSVTYTFGSSGGLTESAPPLELQEGAMALADAMTKYEKAAREYVAMFFEVTE